MTSCEVFDPKKPPLVPAPEKANEPIDHAIEIRVDGDSFHVVSDSLHLRYVDLMKVDSVLPDLVGNSIDSSVVITWTEATTYGAVINVIEVLKKNGIRNYSMDKAE